jgi:ParB family transcriptional regulator, chromosome partitioning protein
MTTSNATATDAASKSEKGHEKLAEKRRALGRGLESLLPGPRAVPAVPAPPTGERHDAVRDSSTASAAAASTPPSSSSLSSAASSTDIAAGRAGTPVTPSERTVVPSTLGELQAVGQSADGETVLLLDIKQIELNPYQTRREFEGEALEELAQSIAVQGVLQPIVVRPSAKEGRFILILGERRMRASELLGKETIPAIVKRVSDQQAAEMTLVENLQRQDLSCMEQASAFACMSRNFKMTQEEIGRRVGWSREQVSNYMRLLQLPYDVYDALEKKYLTYSHARLLLSLQDDTEISKVGQIAIRQKMSVAKLEDFIQGMNFGGKAEERGNSGARWVDPNVRAAQRSLETVLGMRVRIQDRKGKGKITIEYGTLEDFDRVVGMLKGK